MAMNLYRRHKRGDGKCQGGHKPDSRNGEFEERKKTWKRCACPIFASGVLDGAFVRRSTEAVEWEAARAIAAAWEAGTPPPPPIPPTVRPSGGALPTEPGAEELVTVKEAADRFLEDHRQCGSTHATLKQYKSLLGRFEAWMASKGLPYIADISTSLVADYRATWNSGPRTAADQLIKLKAFFDFAIEKCGLEKNPVLKQPRRRRQRRVMVDDTQKLPFTDAELAAMYDACERYGQPMGIHPTPCKWHAKKRKDVGRKYPVRELKWSGRDLADFIALSVYTGLRISDVALFNISRLRANGEVVIRATKNGAQVCTWVPEWLEARIRERGATVGPFIFGQHTSKDLDVITEGWRRRLRDLWRGTGCKWEETPTPHRFRHTFARILLQEHTPVSVVADLLGDTEETVRAHYAAWVPERQERVTTLLRGSFAKTPKPVGVVDTGKVVRIKRHA